MNILMTGGSSGIGLCLAEELKKSHSVSTPTRDQLDLSCNIDYDFTSYDAVILCAGSDIGGKKPFCEMADWHWKNTMQVNLLGNMQITKKYVEQRGNLWGKIIVIGSTATDHIWPNMLPYSISKLALEQFCRALRQEIPKNIGISILRPGLVKTGFHRARHQNQISEQEERDWYESKPHLSADELIPAVISMLDDRAHSIKEVTISP